MGIGNDLWQMIQYGRQALEDLQDETTGTLVNTYNAIVDIWEINCQGSWILYVKTGLTASGAALYLLLTPTFEEVLENYLEPKPGRLGGRRGRPDDRKRRRTATGRTRVYYKPGIPDIDTEVASWLPGADLLSGRAVGPGEYLFWTTLNVVDRVLWQFLLIEATETFFTRWVSGMMQSGECTFPNDGTCQAETPVITSLVSQDIWEDETLLLFKHEENLDIKNAGEIRLINAWEIADWMIALQTYWTFVADNNPGHTILDIAIKVRAYDTLHVLQYEEETTQQLTLRPNQTISTTLNQTDFPNGILYCICTYHVSTYHPGPGWTLSRWAKLAAATRNTRVQ